MKQLSALLLPVLFSLLLSGCVLKEPIAPEYEAYIGNWESQVYVIQILPNGGAIFDSNQLWDPSRIEGRVKFKDNRIIFIGTSDDDGGRRGLDIDLPPSTRIDSLSGETIHYMVLNAVELIRN